MSEYELPPTIPMEYSFEFNGAQRYLFQTKIGHVHPAFYLDVHRDSAEAQELYEVFTPITPQETLLENQRLAKKYAMNIETVLDLSVDSLAPRPCISTVSSSLVAAGEAYPNATPNFQQVTRELLAPPPRLVVQALFAGSASNARVVFVRVARK